MSGYRYLKPLDFINTIVRAYFKIFFSSPATLFSLAILIIYIGAGIAVVIGIVPPLPPARGGWQYIYAPPSLNDFPWYLLGTDFSGRPLLLAIVRGIPSTLLIAFLAAVITVAVGTLIGLVAGYVGRWVDQALSFITNVALTIPTYLLALILVVILPVELKTNPFILAGVLSLTAWASLARSVRAVVLSLRRREFIDVAKTLGFSTRKIIFDEILRFLAPYIAMNLVLGISWAIYGYTGLAFLGIMPMSSDNWGVQIYQAIRAGGALYSDKAILALWSPIVTIVLLMFALINIARAMEEIFNPALRVKVIEEGA